MLSKAGFVDAVHGKGGGYRLNRSPEKYPVREILELTEDSLAPVVCLECGAEECEKPHRREGAAPQLRGGDEAEAPGAHQRADGHRRGRPRLLRSRRRIRRYSG